LKRSIASRRWLGAVSLVSALIQKALPLLVTAPWPVTNTPADRSAPSIFGLLGRSSGVDGTGAGALNDRRDHAGLAHGPGRAGGLSPWSDSQAECRPGVARPVSQ
jgi:hypothetical protein